MGQMRATNFSHGLPRVVEETPHQNDVSAEAEQRHQHILESMAKLEGHPRAATVVSSPTHSMNRPYHSSNSQFVVHRPPQQYEPLPFRQSFTGFPATPQVVPCYYYCPVYPTNLMPMHCHFVERNSFSSFNPPLTPRSTNLKHSSAPINYQGSTSQDFETQNLKQDSPLNAHHFNRRYSKHDEAMKTPQRSHRSPSVIVSPASSPESSLSTPPPILKYHRNENQSDYVKKPFKLQFSESHQHRQQEYPGHPDLKKFHSSQSSHHVVESHRSLDYSIKSKPKSVKEGKNFDNLISSNNHYALQLESKKTGTRLVDKKRLTSDEVKVLQALPPLPPRPNPKILSPCKKEKKDPFAWFRY